MTQGGSHSSSPADATDPVAQVALTGGTGFIGGHLARALAERGQRVRMLHRRPLATPLPPRMEAFPGSLEDERSLECLVRGADIIVHAAGAIRAPDVAAFIDANAGGTERLLAATARAAPEAAFIHLSSLSARRPAISPYAASKRRGEELALAHVAGGGVAVIRPPAVYGPGDRATLPIFAQLTRGFLVTPPGDDRRFSLLHIDDLVACVLACIDRPPAAASPLEPDDGRPGGYRWRDLAEIAQSSLGRKVRRIALPRGVFLAAARLGEVGERASGRPAPISRDKVAELFADEWVAEPATMHGIDWQAQTRFEEGFPATLGWYRAQGWLS
jgi:2-alkyl-3-oxoalkanoate reductase